MTPITIALNLLTALPSLVQLESEVGQLVAGTTAALRQMVSQGRNPTPAEWEVLNTRLAQLTEGLDIPEGSGPNDVRVQAVVGATPLPGVFVLQPASGGAGSQRDTPSGVALASDAGAIAASRTPAPQEHPTNVTLADAAPKTGDATGVHLGEFPGRAGNAQGPVAGENVPGKGFDTSTRETFSGEPQPVLKDGSLTTLGQLHEQTVPPENVVKPSALDTMSSLFGGETAPGAAHEGAAGVSTSGSIKGSAS